MSNLEFYLVVGLFAAVILWAIGSWFRQNFDGVTFLRMSAVFGVLLGLLIWVMSLTGALAGDSDTICKTRCQSYDDGQTVCRTSCY